MKSSLEMTSIYAILKKALIRTGKGLFTVKYGQLYLMLFLCLFVHTAVGKLEGKDTAFVQVELILVRL